MPKSCAACGRSFVDGRPNAYCLEWYHDFEREPECESEEDYALACDAQHAAQLDAQERYYVAEERVRDQMSCEGIEFGDEMPDAVAAEMHRRTLAWMAAE